MTNVFEEQYTVQKWDKDYYHPIALYLYDNLISDMINLMNAEPGATILDAGCGPGVHSIRIAKKGYHICAIDISKTMLGYAEKRIKDAGVIEKVVLYQKDLTSLDFPDSSFRYVFAWGVIIHIPDIEKAIDELSRIIQPGGKLALYVTNRSAIDYKIESFIRLIFHKPLKNVYHLPLGDKILFKTNAGELWLWRIDIKALTDYLVKKGFCLMDRRIGELSEIQIRLPGIARTLLLHVNNLAYDLKLPSRLAIGNLLIFQKVN